MNDTLVRQPGTRASVRSILLIAVLGAATAVGLGAMTLPDQATTTSPAVDGHAFSQLPGVSYTLTIPESTDGR